MCTIEIFCQKTSRTSLPCRDPSLASIGCWVGVVLDEDGTGSCWWGPGNCCVWIWRPGFSLLCVTSFVWERYFLCYFFKRQVLALVVIFVCWLLHVVSLIIRFLIIITSFNYLIFSLSLNFFIDQEQFAVWLLNLFSMGFGIM